MSDQAQLLELAQRLLYNELKRSHATARMSSTTFVFRLSEELRQRDALIALDLPRGAPSLTMRQCCIWACC